jgi:hypothetical protein
MLITDMKDLRMNIQKFIRQPRMKLKLTRPPVTWCIPVPILLRQSFRGNKTACATYCLEFCYHTTTLHCSVFLTVLLIRIRFDLKLFDQGGSGGNCTEAVSDHLTKYV